MGLSSTSKSNFTYTKSISLSTKRVSSVLTTDRATVHDVVGLNTIVGAQDVLSAVVNDTHTLTIEMQRINSLKPKIVSDDTWAKFKALEGLWADEDVDEMWLNELRSGWDDRLRDLYGSDWD